MIVLIEVIVVFSLGFITGAGLLAWWSQTALTEAREALERSTEALQQQLRER